MQMLLQLQISKIWLHISVQENSSLMRGYLTRALLIRLPRSGEGISGWWSRQGSVKVSLRYGKQISLSVIEVLVRSSRRLRQSEEGVKCQTEEWGFFLVGSTEAFRQGSGYRLIRMVTIAKIHKTDVKQRPATKLQVSRYIKWLKLGLEKSTGRKGKTEQTKTVLM